MLLEKRVVNVGEMIALHIEIYDGNMPLNELKAGDLKFETDKDGEVQYYVFIDEKDGWLHTPISDTNYQDSVVHFLYRETTTSDARIYRILNNDPDFQGGLE